MVNTVLCAKLNIQYACMMKPAAVLSLLFLLTACSPQIYQSTRLDYKDYRIKAGGEADASVNTLLKPYADSVNSTMEKVVGSFATAMDKNQPEGSLGNFMADAFLFEARKQYQQPVDFALMNYGGIRLTNVPAGNITTGKLFELMPFDNILVLLKMKGVQVQQFFDHIAGRGGWPVAGASFGIKNKKAVNLQIGGKKIDPNATYTMAIGDYVANGGDDAAMLKNIPQVNNGYLQRDALIDYVKEQTAAGKAVAARVEGRVVTVE